MRLRRPLILILLAAFLPLAGLSVVLGIAAVRSEQERVERGAIERVRQLAAALGQELQGQLDVLRVLAQAHDFDHDVPGAEFQELAQRVSQEMPAWRGLRLTDPDGRIVADFPSEPVLGARGGRVVDPETHRLAVESRRPAIGRVLRGPNGRPAFALRAPVLREGVVKYVLSAVVSPDEIRDRLLRPGLPEPWIATVVDGAGNIVARSFGSGDLVGQSASAGARAARQSGREGLYAGVVLEGVATVSAWRMLPLGNWSVHIGVPRDVFMAPLQRAFWGIGAGIAAVLVLTVVFLWLLLREIKLRRREELGVESGRRLEALGRMTGGVAHDFNNLLMIVQGGAEGLKRSSDPQKQKNYLEAIFAAVQRAQALTRQLLAFGQHGAQEPVTFRLQERSAVLKEMLTRSVRETVRLQLSVPAETWPLRADPNALEVALINLAVNASDAMPDGGTLAIAATNVVLEKGRQENPGMEGAFVAIEVRDAGTGIAPDHVDRIFEPFFTTKAKGHGTGLGLSQVYGFAQQSGGAVTVKSRLGEGTTFTLYLPRGFADAAAPPRLPPPAPLVGAREGNILLVEDNPQVAAVTAANLADAGYDVTTAASASAAREWLAAGNIFDALVSDIVMVEGISGVDLARWISDQHPGLPVVLVTGYSEALKAAKLKEVTVLYKPFTQAQLLAALAALLPATARATTGT